MAARPRPCWRVPRARRTLSKRARSKSLASRSAARSRRPAASPLPRDAACPSPPPRRPRSRSRQLDALRRYGRDFTEEARRGLLDPVIGRQPVIQRVMQARVARARATRRGAARPRQSPERPPGPAAAPRGCGPWRLCPWGGGEARALAAGSARQPASRGTCPVTVPPARRPRCPLVHTPRCCCGAQRTIPSSSERRVGAWPPGRLATSGACGPAGVPWRALWPAAAGMSGLGRQRCNARALHYLPQPRQPLGACPCAPRGSSPTPAAARPRPAPPCQAWARPLWWRASRS